MELWLCSSCCDKDVTQQLLLGLAPAVRVYAIWPAGACPGQATIQNTSTPWIRIKPHTRHLSWMMQCGIKTKHGGGEWVTSTNNVGETSVSNSDDIDGYPSKSTQNRNHVDLLWRPVSSYAGFRFDPFAYTLIILPLLYPYQLHPYPGWPKDHTATERCARFDYAPQV